MARGVPTAAELADAAREFLEGDVMPVLDGRLLFLARVAANVIAQIERELELGPRRVRVHAERLARLGVSDDAELCRAIRDGSLDDRMDEVVTAARASVIEKLAISNPRYLTPQDRHNLQATRQAVDPWK